MYRLVILAFIVGVYGQDSNFSCQERINILKDDSSWYGYGVVKYKKMRKNKSLQEAKEIALGDLASKINTKVKSFVSINSSEIIKNSKTDFIQSSSSETFTSTSAEISDYKIDFSGSCSNKQYLVVVKLNKQDFFYQQETLMRQYLVQSSKAISGNNSFKNKLSYIDETYSSLRDIGRLVGVDSGLLDEYYSQISLLKEEYDRLIRDITIDFNLSSPLMYHTNKSIQLILSIYDKKTKKSITDMSIDIKNQNTNERILLKINSEGIAKLNLPVDIKEITPINFNATIDISSELKGHILFEKYRSSNPNYDYILNTIPLAIKQEISTDNKYLQKKLTPITLSLHKLIQNDMKVSFDSNAPAYILQLRCDSVSQYIASNGQYVIKFLPTVYLINQTTNVVEFQFNFPEQKGLSWIEYDKSFKHINKSMNQYIEEISDGIIQVFM